MKTQDLYHCYSVNEGKLEKDPFKCRKEAYEYSFTQNNVCYYDEETDKFYDRNGQEFDVKNKRILIKSGIQELNLILQAILEKRGIPVNRVQDLKRICNWNQEVSTERITFTVTGKVLLESEEIKQKIVEMAGETGKFFLKTKKKDFSSLIYVEELFNSNLGLLEALKIHAEDEFIISEEIEIVKDDLGNLEYRCFVIDGEICNISRPLFLTYHSISKEVEKAAQKLLDKIKKISDFPSTFCLDFMQCQIPRTNVIIYDFVELNPLEATGEYLYNTRFENEASADTNYSLATEEELLIKQMKEAVPIYKKNKDLSFDNHEPKRVMQQCYHRNGFSYHYGCIKKFGDPFTDRFETYMYSSVLGGGHWVTTEDILNGNVSLLQIKANGDLNQLVCEGILKLENINKRIEIEEYERKREILPRLKK